MIPLATISVLALTALAVVLLRLARPRFGFGWLVAAGGALLAWASTLAWQFSLPQTLVLGPVLPQGVFSYTPALLADRGNFPYALALTALGVAIIWTSAVRSSTTSPLAWASTLALTALGLIAVLAGNVLTLLLALAAIDLLELVNTLRATDDPVTSETLVVAFSVRLLGLALILWGAVAGAAAGSPLNFASMPSQGSVFLALGVGIRVAATLYRQPSAQEPELRRGYGSALRLISVAAGLSLLARIPPGGISANATAWLLALAAVIGLVSGLNWLRTADVIEARRFFLAGMSVLAFAAALRGSATGSTAWGSALVLCGGLASLYTLHQPRLTALLVIGAFILSALPYSLTASGWTSNVHVSWIFWIPLVAIQGLMLAGYVLGILKPVESSLEAEPNWARIVYPTGLMILLGSGVLLGLWGWDGAQQLGVIPAALAASLLGGGLSLLVWRVPGLQNAVRPPARAGERLAGTSASIFRAFAALAWAVYRLLGRATGLLARTLEGDGGLLWTMVILALVMSIVGGVLR